MTWAAVSSSDQHLRASSGSERHAGSCRCGRRVVVWASETLVWSCCWWVGRSDLALADSWDELSKISVRCCFFCVFCPCAFVCLVCLLSTCVWILVWEVAVVGLVLLVPQCVEVNLQSDGHFAAQEWPCLSATTTPRPNPWACRLSCKGETHKDYSSQQISLLKVACFCTAATL